MFGVGGGGIGRAHDNDWVLPDPQRYLSAHHARVQFRDGAYLPARHQHQRRVRQRRHRADRPAQHLSAARRRSAAAGRLPDRRQHRHRAPSEAPEASAIFPVNPAARSTASSIAARADIGVELQRARPAAPDASPDNRMRRGRRLRPATADRGYRPAGIRSAVSAPAPARASASSPAQRRAGASRAWPSAPAENAAGIEAFCRGAGIDAKQLPADAAGAPAASGGLLLREALAGTEGPGAGATRDARTDAYRGRQGGSAAHRTDRAAGRGSAAAAAARPRQRDLDAVQWVREMLGQHAPARSCHDARPARRAGRISSRGSIRARWPRSMAAPSGADAGTADSAALAARFRSITEMPAGKLPHLFAEAFARAFAAAFKHEQRRTLQVLIRGAHASARRAHALGAGRCAP